MTVVPTELQERDNVTMMYKPNITVSARSWKTHATMRAQSLNGACFRPAMIFDLLSVALANVRPFAAEKRQETTF